MLLCRSSLKKKTLNLKKFKDLFKNDQLLRPDTLLKI